MLPAAYRARIQALDGEPVTHRTPAAGAPLPLRCPVNHRTTKPSDAR